MIVGGIDVGFGVSIVSIVSIVSMSTTNLAEPATAILERISASPLSRWIRNTILLPG